QGLRSLRDLTQHLTTRADDSHAAPLQTSLRKPTFVGCHLQFKPITGSSRCIELSHILHRLCGPPSISLSFNLATVFPRRRVYRVSFATKGVDSFYSKYAPFTAHI